jgi:hypothetical protein
MIVCYSSSIIKGSSYSLLSGSIFGSYVLNARPSIEFAFEPAKDKLSNLNFESESGPEVIITTPREQLVVDGDYQNLGVGRKGRLMRLASCIDLESRLTVRNSRFHVSVNSVAHQNRLDVLELC